MNSITHGLKHLSLAAAFGVFAIALSAAALTAPTAQAQFEGDFGDTGSIGGDWGGDFTGGDWSSWGYGDTGGCDYGCGDFTGGDWSSWGYGDTGSCDYGCGYDESGYDSGYDYGYDYGSGCGSSCGYGYSSGGYGSQGYKSSSYSYYPYSYPSYTTPSQNCVNNSCNSSVVKNINNNTNINTNVNDSFNTYAVRDRDYDRNYVRHYDYSYDYDYEYDYDYCRNLPGFQGYVPASYYAQGGNCFYQQYNQTPYVSLSAVPYTGLELGPVGTALYWGFLVLWCAIAAYLIAVKKVQNKIVSGLSAFLFPTTAKASASHVHAPAKAETIESPVPAGVDPFIAQQLNKYR